MWVGAGSRILGEYIHKCYNERYTENVLEIGSFYHCVKNMVVAYVHENIKWVLRDH